MRDFSYNPKLTGKQRRVLLLSVVIWWRLYKVTWREKTSFIGENLTFTPFTSDGYGFRILTPDTL